MGDLNPGRVLHYLRAGPVVGRGEGRCANESARTKGGPSLPRSPSRDHIKIDRIMMVPPYVSIGNASEVLRLAQDAGITSAVPEAPEATLVAGARSAILIELMSEISVLHERLDQARESLKSALLERDTTDITRAGELGARERVLGELVGRLELVSAHHAEFLLRLQQPYVGEGIDVHPQYHRYVSELFPAVAQWIKALPETMENLEWALTSSTLKATLDQASASATKVLATYQSYYGSLNHTQQLLQRVAEKPYTRLVTSAETATSSLTASASAEQVSLI